MPHTSHRKKTPRTKRSEVVGEDGWTRVTTTNNAQRKPRPLPAQGALERRYGELYQHRVITYPQTVLPKDITVDKTERQYRSIEKKWLESESCRQLESCMQDQVDIEVLQSIDKCFVFGTGTFSGLVRGWVDRSHVSMYQLAAFISVINCIERITGKRPVAFAQEPIYNELDIDFLSRLNILTVDTPNGFKAVTTGSFVYLPGAELEVTLRTLACNPALTMLSGVLDMYWRNDKGEACTNAVCIHVESNISNADKSDKEDGSQENEKDDKVYEDDKFKALHEMTEQEENECHNIERLRDEIEEGMQVCEEFKKGKEVRKLPSLDAKDEPFYNVHLYYRQAHEDADGGESKTNSS